MAVNAPVQIDRQRIKELIEREEKALNDRTRKSEHMYKRAHAVLSGGVASSYQLRDPWPIYLERGQGPKVWDVDGNEMFDFHNGFGSMVQGHAHPAIGRAISGRYGKGTHFAAPTEDGVVVAEELARRFRLPRWRYTNSGSEATMDGIRIARAYTGRDTVMKIFDSETFKANQDAELADLAWLFNMNRGIFMTPGREEEWTLSVTHTDEAVDRYVAVFDEMARELTQ